MNHIDVSPIYWTSELLAEQGNDVLHGLVTRAVGTETSYKVLAGRCLVAGESTGLFAEHGCSGATHYAVAAAGVSEREGRECRRVASKLDGLPLLRRAAEEGEVPWGKLREVVRKADPLTERYWLALMGKRTYAEIEALVASADPGGLPEYSRRGDSGEQSITKTELRCVLPPQVMTIVQRGLEALSQAKGRRVSMPEALELLFSQVLSRSTLDDEKAIDGVRSEADKDLQAVESRKERLVREAREFAMQMGFLAGERRVVEAKAAKTQATEADSATGDPGGSTRNGPANGVIPTDVGVTFAAEISTNLDDNSQPARVTLDDQSITSAWLETTAASLEICPTDETVMIARPGQPTWRNKKLRFNEKARGLTPAQRKDLLRRDGYCCSTPGCPHKLWLHGHHLKEYALNGPTAPSNVVFLCPRCHKNVHEGHLSIIGSPEDGSLEFRDAYGRKVGVGSRLERAVWLDTWQGWSGDSEQDSRALELFLEDGGALSADSALTLRVESVDPMSSGPPAEAFTPSQ